MDQNEIGDGRYSPEDGGKYQTHKCIGGSRPWIGNHLDSSLLAAPWAQAWPTRSGRFAARGKIQRREPGSAPVQPPLRCRPAQSENLSALAPPKRVSHATLRLGWLPVESINRTLGTELEPGEVILTASAQAHAFKSHPADYERCLPHVGFVVGSPRYAGDDFKNPGKIELVSRIPALGTGLLVALSIELSADGSYRVASFYPVSERKIESRRQNGRLKIVRMK